MPNIILYTSNTSVRSLLISRLRLSSPNTWSCSACVSYLFILTISVRPIISTFIEPIFTKFAGLVELWLYDKRSKVSFLMPQMTLPWQPIFVDFIDFYYRIGFARHSVDGRRTTRSASAALDVSERIN